LPDQAAGLLAIGWSLTATSANPATKSCDGGHPHHPVHSRAQFSTRSSLAGALNKQLLSLQAEAQDRQSPAMTAPGR